MTGNVWVGIIISYFILQIHPLNFLHFGALCKIWSIFITDQKFHFFFFEIFSVVLFFWDYCWSEWLYQAEEIHQALINPSITQMGTQKSEMRNKQDCHSIMKTKGGKKWRKAIIQKMKTCLGTQTSNHINHYIHTIDMGIITIWFYLYQLITITSKNLRCAFNYNLFQ